MQTYIKALLPILALLCATILYKSGQKEAATAVLLFVSRPTAPSEPAS